MDYRKKFCKLEERNSLIEKDHFPAKALGQAEDNIIW